MYTQMLVIEASNKQARRYAPLAHKIAPCLTIPNLVPEKDFLSNFLAFQVSDDPPCFATVCYPI